MLVDVFFEILGVLSVSSSSYLQANAVASSSASALVVINGGADGEDLFRVAATLGGSSEDGEEPKGPDNMPTVSESVIDVFKIVESR